jgi:hypothetical protein
MHGSGQDARGAEFRGRSPASVRIASRALDALLSLAPGQRGPIEFRHAPLLASGDLGDVDGPLSSILHPPGLRASLRRHMLGAEHAFEASTRAPDEPVSGAALTRLRNDVEQFTSLEPERQAEVLACLNCLTEQYIALDCLPALTTALYAHVAGCHAMYEGARCLLRIHRESPHARAVLTRLAERPPVPWIGASSSIQLCAAAVRFDQDLPSAAAALARARAWCDEMNASARPFESALARSRLLRVEALLAFKLGRPRESAESLDRALSVAGIAVELSSARSSYANLVALENRKIVLEARAKACADRRDDVGFAIAATDLIRFDPEDAVGWRTTATGAARLGWMSTAAIALAGHFSLGGVGGSSIVAALGGIDRIAPSSSDLDAVLLETIEALCDSAGEY